MSKQPKHSPAPPTDAQTPGRPQFAGWRLYIQRRLGIERVDHTIRMEPPPRGLRGFACNDGMVTAEVTVGDLTARTMWPVDGMPDLDDLRAQFGGPTTTGVVDLGGGVGAIVDRGQAVGLVMRADDSPKPAPDRPKRPRAGRLGFGRVTLSRGGGYDPDSPGATHDKTLPLGPGETTCGTCGEDHHEAKEAADAAE